MVNTTFGEGSGVDEVNTSNPKPGRIPNIEDVKLHTFADTRKDVGSGHHSYDEGALAAYDGHGNLRIIEKGCGWGDHEEVPGAEEWAEGDFLRHVVNALETPTYQLEGREVPAAGYIDLGSEKRENSVTPGELSQLAQMALEGEPEYFVTDNGRNAAVERSI